MNYSPIVFPLTILYASVVFSVNVNIISSQHSEIIEFEKEPNDCKILAYVKKNIEIFFPGITKSDRGLTIIRSCDSSYYVRLSNDSHCYHCNETGLYICEHCSGGNIAGSVDFGYKILPPHEYNLHCHRCNKYFISEDDHTVHLLQCVPSLLEKIIN